MTGGPCPSKDNWKFDATSKKWTRLEECSTPRVYPSMAMLPPLNGPVRRAVLYGGNEKTRSVLGVSITKQIIRTNISHNRKYQKLWSF